MDGELAESNTLIKSMQRRVYKNKATLYGVLGFVALGVVAIVYSYFA